jgi:hypothetical protein
MRRKLRFEQLLLLAKLRLVRRLRPAMHGDGSGLQTQMPGSEMMS